MNNTPTPRTDENLNMITPNQRLQNGNNIFVAKMEILMDERTREIRKASSELIQEIKSLKAQLTAVTEQRDRLAEAIITHRAKAWPLTGEQFDQDLWDTLAAVKGVADESV